MSEDTHSISIVSVDSYMAVPIPGVDVTNSEFRGASIQHVPVLRIYGSLPTGVKICVHIHGVFPYFYLPYDDIEEVNGLMQHIAKSIDKAVNISLNQTTSNVQHVYKISLVSGIPMYGYHNKPHQYLKVSFYNPRIIRRVCNLLQNDSTLGKLYQPHESHISYTLQFMIDYNLHGMSTIQLSSLKYRRNPSNIPEVDPELSMPESITRITVCELEADALAEHICNHTGNFTENPGIAALWEDERQRRRNKNEESQIGSCLTLSQNDVKPTKSHVIFDVALKTRLAIISTDKPKENVADLSVYPAETPPDVEIQNASLIDLNTPGNDSFDMTMDMNETLLDQTLCEDGNELLDVLLNLNENAKQDESLEDDCILSQMIEEEDDSFDLSMPLQSITTPRKMNIQDVNEEESDEDTWNESLNTTLIPQLDGPNDSSDAESVVDSVGVEPEEKTQPAISLPSNSLDVTMANGPRIRSDKASSQFIYTSENSTESHIGTSRMELRSSRRLGLEIEQALKILESDIAIDCNSVAEQSDSVIGQIGDQSDVIEGPSVPLQPARDMPTLDVADTDHMHTNVVVCNSSQSTDLNSTDSQTIVNVKKSVPKNTDEFKVILTELKNRKQLADQAKIENVISLSRGCVEVRKRASRALPSVVPSRGCVEVRKRASRAPPSFVPHTNQTLMESVVEEIQFLETLCNRRHCKLIKNRIIKLRNLIPNIKKHERIIRLLVQHKRKPVYKIHHYNQNSNYVEKKYPKTVGALDVDPNKTFYGQIQVQYSEKELYTFSEEASSESAPSAKQLPKLANCDVNVKRKLNFSYTSPIVRSIPKQLDNIALNDQMYLVNSTSVPSTSKLHKCDQDHKKHFEEPINCTTSTNLYQYDSTSESGNESNSSSEDGSDCNLSKSTPSPRHFVQTDASPPNCTKKLKHNDPELDISWTQTNFIKGKHLIVLKPRNLKPPTKCEIIRSIPDSQFDRFRNQEPFYSNVEDVTGNVEIGHNVLRIGSKTTLDLNEFETHFALGLSNVRKCQYPDMKWSKSAVDNLKLSFCVDRPVILAPIQKPPRFKDVLNWSGPIKVKKKVKASVDATKRILLPGSPNGDDNEDNVLDMSISMNTSSAETTSNSSLRLRSLRNRFKSKNTSLNESGKISGVSANADNTYEFERSIQNYQDARTVVKHQLLTMMLMELHTRTRGDLKPNPEYDSVRAIFYSILHDAPESLEKPRQTIGIIVIDSLPISPKKFGTPSSLLSGAGVGEDCDVQYVNSEENLINAFLKLVYFWNPDIFGGYEIELLSWGYLIERASVLGMNLSSLLSRIKPNDQQQFRDNTDPDGGLQLPGRIVLDIWRLMRHEISLQSYTFESIAYHILHVRVPLYSFKNLSFWWDHPTFIYRHRTVHHYLIRVQLTLEILNKLDIVNRTAELARLFGIQFYEVFSRGSQFRVESMMLRLAKPQNYIPVSPSVQQRANMRAPEFLPLILEPESKLYVDPVIVLDFQSLYPSMIIAYNYCFTTCLGRVEHLGTNIPFDFGATQLRINRKLLARLQQRDEINYSPCGVAFVKSKIRDGILPRMLREILETRLMVKASMKDNKDNKTLQKVLHSRQLGLKLIANVTYGYTAANFSGRMPSVEIADSVLSKGRETLQRAISMVDGTPEWGARVVYGDTDSLFVLVPGKSREQAFEVGRKIADAVTNDNPNPVKLKLEKVYQPCILQTKKRYVGYLYENADQKEPVFDAKGIETVRRDGCPAVSKMLEKCIRLLFETKDVSLIKKYVLRQFNKIFVGRVSIQDLTFAKEYRGAAGYRPGACVPALELARKWTAVDKRNDPRRGQRVPYVIINGPPGMPLIRMVRSPYELLNDSTLRPNALYYITKVIIPPINRCFSLIGADLSSWFNEMPRKLIQEMPTSSPGKRSTIAQYFLSTKCARCGIQTQNGICETCISQPQETVICLMDKIRLWERNYYETNLICQSCTRKDENVCISLDCPVMYRIARTGKDLQLAEHLYQLISCGFDL